MSLRFLSGVIGACLILASCKREERNLNPGAAGAIVQSVQLSRIQPGGSGATPAVGNDLEKVAYDVNEGKRLFNLYNCSGATRTAGEAWVPL